MQKITTPTNPTPCAAPPPQFTWPTLNPKPHDPEITIPHHAFHLQLTIDTSHLSTIVPHVNNLEYVRWLEVLATTHADALGYDDAYCRRANIIWFVGRHEIDYRAELSAGDEVIMATWIEDLHKYRAHRRYVIARIADQRLVTTARTSWVLVSRDLHRPIRVPIEMQQRFQPPTHTDPTA